MSFYDRVLDNDIVGDFFEDVDMTKLVDHQTKFVTTQMGGPASYSDDRLHQLHAHLEISGDEFDEMAKLLQATLNDHGLTDADAATVVAAVHARRGFIVG